MFYGIIKLPTLVPLRESVRHISASKSHSYKVGIVGAAGGIGQPLSMLLKLDQDVTLLHMHDVARHIPGLAADCSHINTPAKCQAFLGMDQMKAALAGMEIVTIPGGIPRQPGMTRDDLFNSNASIIKDVAQVVAEVCPEAVVTIITNPVNAVVPIFAAVMNKAGKLNPNKIMGVTTLDLLRSSTFAAELKGICPSKVKVMCIGAHAGITIIPVFSQAEPPLNLSKEEVVPLTKRVQGGGGYVVKLKAGMGSATLSTAFAAYRLIQAIIKGFKGQPNMECTYWMNNVAGTKFFSTPVQFGKNGIEKDLGIPPLNEYEKEQVKAASAVIKKSVEKGEKFVG